MIIDSFKRYSQTWWFRAFLFMLALTLGFLWYGQDIMTTTRGGAGSIGSVGKSKITMADFSRAFHAQVSRIQNTYNTTLTNEQQKQIYPLVVQTLVIEKLIEKETDRLEIAVDDLTIRRVITQDDHFKDETNKFNRQIFESFLNNAGYREDSYVNLLRKDLTQKNLIQTLFSNVSTPKFLTLALYKYQHQRRTLSVITLESQKIKINHIPSQEEIINYFKNNPSKFLRPEVRDISMLVFDHSILKDQVKISNEEILQLYKNRSDEFSGKSFEEVKGQLKDELTKQVVSEKMFETVNKIDDAVAGGASLEEIAKTYNLTLQNYLQISKEGVSYHQNSATSASHSFNTTIEPRILQDIFLEKQQDTTKVTEMSEGKFFLAHINKVHSSRPLTLDESKNEAEKLLIQDLQEKEIKNMAQDFEKQINTEAFMASWAYKKGLKPTQFPVSRAGPLVPISLYLPENFVTSLYATPLKRAKVISYLNDENHLNIIIGVVDKIEMPQEVSDQNSLKSFEQQLKQEIENNLYQEYLQSLEKIYPVNYNNHVLERLTSQGQ